MTDWKVVRGSQEQKPKEFDTETSSAVAYQRRNIVRLKEKDSMTGEEYEYWQYEERELSHAEYAAIRAETQQGQIDEAGETALAGLMAVTDLYEELLNKGVL